MVINYSLEGELGKVEPEIVALSGQTVDEVKELLVKTKDPVKDKVNDVKCRTFRNVHASFAPLKPVFAEEVKETVEEIKTSGKPKLLFEESCPFDTIPDVRSAKTKRFNDLKKDLLFSEDLRVLAGVERQTEKVKDFTWTRTEELSCKKFNPKDDFEQFSLWRKTAGVKQTCDDWAEGTFGSSKDLIEFIKSEIKSKFPNLDAEWSKEDWNPRLLINGSPTQISLERIAVAYKGLSFITDELNTKAIIANIVLKKLKELFI